MFKLRNTVKEQTAVQYIFRQQLKASGIVVTDEQTPVNLK